VARAAAELGVDVLGEIPLDVTITPSGDQGDPIVHARPDSDVARRFLEVARKVAAGVRAAVPTA
jgi:ATP-binding protein involved in chromosome partitioning